MSDYCPENDRIIYKYFDWLKNAKQRTDGTIEQIRKALHHYQVFLKHADFRTFNPTIAKAYKGHLRDKKSQRSGEALSVSTIHHTLNHVQEFLMWLSQEPGYRSRIRPADIEYLNLTSNEERAAKAPGYRAYPTVEQVLKTLRSMPANDEIQLRNRAMLALLLLTGARVDALVSFCIKHIHLDKRMLVQNPREVRTKRRKLIITPFYPVGQEVLKIFSEYYEFLVKEKLFSLDDPLFPKTLIEQNAKKLLIPAGLSRKFWRSGTQASRILKQAFIEAGLPAFSPHAIRHTMARLGEQKCEKPEEFKAWSLGFGHEHVRTSFAYAHMSTDAQIAQIEKFWDEPEQSKDTNVSLQDEIRELKNLLLTTHVKRTENVPPPE